jgi:hypothetical protein
MENEFTKEEIAKKLKQASNRLENTTQSSCELLCLEKKNGNNGRRGVFSWNDPRPT